MGIWMCSSAMSVHWQVFVWIYVFSFLGCIPRSRIAGSYSKWMLNCFLKWLFTNDFDFLSFQLEMYEIYLSVLLICFSFFKPCGVEHLFVCSHLCFFFLSSVFYLSFLYFLLLSFPCCQHLLVLVFTCRSLIYFELYVV